jgi:hypothetical protein
LAAIDFGQIVIWIFGTGLLMGGFMVTSFRLSRNRAAPRNDWLKYGAYAFVASAMISLLYLLVFAAAAGFPNFPTTNPILFSVNTIFWVSVGTLCLGVWELLKVIAIHFNPNYRPAYSISEYLGLFTYSVMQFLTSFFLVLINWRSFNPIGWALAGFVVVSYVGFGGVVLDLLRKQQGRTFFGILWFSPYIFLTALALIEVIVAKL